MGPSQVGPPLKAKQGDLGGLVRISRAGWACLQSSKTVPPAGQVAERSLRSRLDNARIFLTGIDNPPSNAKEGARTIAQTFADAAEAVGLFITSREIEAAFATIAQDRVDALFVGPDGFFNARRVQFATLAAQSYGTDLLDMYRQVGVYTCRILKGANPSDLPVMQSAKYARRRPLGSSRRAE